MLRNFISVYFNPKESPAVLTKLREDFRRTFFRHSIQFRTPPSIDHLSQDIKQDLDNGVDTFGCVGGDGTMNRLLREIHPSGAKIFLIPGGTANDLGNELGLTKKVAKMKRIVQYQTTKDVDVLDVNGAPFITHGGIGVGARLCEFMNEKRDESPSFFKFVKKLKADSYAVSIAKQLLFDAMPIYDVTMYAPHLPPEGMRVKSPMILISNQAKIAGVIPIAPYTDNADKSFCVSVFLSKTNLEFLGQFLKLRRKKRLTDLETFFQFETPSLRLEVHGLAESGPDSAIPFLGDGDVLLRDRSFFIGVREHRQTFFYTDPKNSYSSSYSLDAVPEL